MTPRTTILTVAAVAAALTTGVVLLTLPEPPPSWPTLTLRWDSSPDVVSGYRVYSASVPVLAAMQPIGETTNLFWPITASNPAAFYQVTALGTNGLESGWAVKRK